MLNRTHTINVENTGKGESTNRVAHSQQDRVLLFLPALNRPAGVSPSLENYTGVVGDCRRIAAKQKLKSISTK